jgi:hypothetical protein
MKLTIRCHEFKPLQRNTLHGFATVLVEELLNIRDIAIHQRNGRRWAQLPAKLIGKDGAALRNAETGKVVYQPLLQFADRRVADAFSENVVEAVLKLHPAALDPLQQSQTSPNQPGGPVLERAQEPLKTNDNFQDGTRSPGRRSFKRRRAAPQTATAGGAPFDDELPW